jgi:hypothetical protein
LSGRGLVFETRRRPEKARVADFRAGRSEFARWPSVAAKSRNSERGDDARASGRAGQDPFAWPFFLRTWRLVETEDA